MQIKFLKSIVEHLINKQAVPVVDLLVGKKDVNEFLIAKKLNLTINQARNILYKLSDYGLVSFIRKKDKRKGWYIYFWTLNVYQSLSLFEEKLRKELEQFESQLKSRKEKRYYNCNTCSIEVTEEAALLNDFTCPECEEVYELNANPAIIQQLEKDIIRVKKEIELAKIERDKEGEKLEKKKVKKIRDADDERKANRKKSRKKVVKKKLKKQIKKRLKKKHSGKKLKKKTSRHSSKFKKKK
jgi:transcription factor E